MRGPPEVSAKSDFSAEQACRAGSLFGHKARGNRAGW